MLLTGTTASLYFGGVRIGKCRSISLSIEREALPTTKQGDLDRTFITGLRGTSGSASLFYDPEDGATDSLLTKVYEDSTTLSGVEMVFDEAANHGVVASVIITRVGISASYGAAQMCDIDFQISGKPTTTLAGTGSETCSPHELMGGTTPTTGVGLKPNLTMYGANSAKSLTWYKNNVKIATLTYTTLGTTITYEVLDQAHPTWLGDSSQGILVIGPNQVNTTYKSLIEFNNGRIECQATTVQAGIVQYNYSYRFRNDGVWQGGLYISYGYPPYLAPGSSAAPWIIYVFNPAAGGYFSGNAGPGITDLEVFRN